MEKNDIIDTEGKKIGDATVAETEKIKPQERLYTKTEVEAKKEATARAVRSKLETEYEGKIADLNQKLNTGKAKTIFEELNGNPDKLADLAKLESLDFTDEKLKEKMVAGLEKHPYFKKDFSNTIQTEKEPSKETKGKQTPLGKMIDMFSQ